MIITEENLKALNLQFNIVPSQSFDTFSLTLHLSRDIRVYNINNDDVITYGSPIGEEHIKTKVIQDEYILRPGQAILACSSEEVKMPKGYIGFLQTKGSLARLFVTVHCCDGQIEPGFSGHVTFEICNIGELNIRLLPNIAVAQLFVAKCSSDKESYNGKYNNSDKPTYNKS